MSIDRKFTVVASIAGVILVALLGVGCRPFCEFRVMADTIPALNSELSQAVTNVNKLNRAMNSRTRQPGLIQNLLSVSRGMTNMDATLGQLGGSLTNLDAGMTVAHTNLHALSSAMVDLTTPLSKLSNEVNSIRHEITNLHIGLNRLGTSIGTLHGQIGVNISGTNTSLPSSGLVGQLMLTDAALRANTEAITQVNFSLTTNNDLLRASTNALKSLDSIKSVLPLLTAMLSLVSALWSAINLGNTARKAASDKLKDKHPFMIESRVEAYLQNGLAAAGRDIGSAISSAYDFRDAYAYAMFQLVVAGLIITAFFGGSIGRDPQHPLLLLTLLFLFVAGVTSLIILYVGDQRDVLLIFSNRWPLKKPHWYYWLCPLLDATNEDSTPCLVKVVRIGFFIMLVVALIWGIMRLIRP